MTARAPLYLTSGNLREMNATDLSVQTQMAVYQYSQSPSVTLAYSLGNTGNLTSIQDTRMQAGASTTDVTNYDTEAETPDISQLAVAWDRFNQTVATTTEPANTDNRAFPVYLTAANQIQSMTAADFVDTFIGDAMNGLESTTVDDNIAGTYFMSTSNSVTDATLVYASPFFIDTRADASAYTSAGIPEAQDQPVNITSYYLHRREWAGSVPSPRLPMYMDSNGHLQEYTSTAWNTMLQDFMRHCATTTIAGSDHGATRLRYDIGTSDPLGGGSQTKGTGMADTRLSGTSASGYTTYFAGVDDYRTQEFPNGTPTTINTYYLWCRSNN
jgi:hypothetical protein